MEGSFNIFMVNGMMYVVGLKILTRALMYG